MTETPISDARSAEPSSTTSSVRRPPPLSGAPLSRLDAIRPLTMAVVRVVLGYLLVRHGLDKFDTGLDNVGTQFAVWGVPASQLSATAVALLEVIGGTALILGIGTRVVSVLAIGMLLGALYFVKFEMGVLGGSETDFAYIAGLIALLGVGPGPWSLDTVLGLERR